MFSFQFIFGLPKKALETVCLKNKHVLFPTAFDLPQRPNEAHIFYGNMSKIVVSLLGSARTSAHLEQPAVPLSPGGQGLQPERCRHIHRSCNNNELACLYLCSWFAASYPIILNFYTVLGHITSMNTT